MTLRVGFHPDAVRELDDAIQWYDQGGQHRGARFRTDVDRVIDRLLEWPESAETILDTPAGRVFRHAKVPHSHYRLVYYLTDEALKIVAIAHERRMLLYWSGRD